MFSLIITIISIALVAALAAASLYYGGDAFNSGSAEANASTLVNQGQQLLGAVELYKAQNGGTAPATYADLTGEGFLQSMPTFSESIASDTWADEIESGAVVGFSVSGVNDAVCDEIEDQYGSGGTYSCTGTAGSYSFVAGTEADVPRS